MPKKKTARRSRTVVLELVIFWNKKRILYKDDFLKITLSDHFRKVKIIPNSVPIQFLLTQ